MPRGNDAEAALHELADKFGKGVGNADQLIEANLQHHTAALRKAEILPRDPERTAEAKENLDSLKVPDGHTAIDAAVRGGVTVVVTEDETGRRHIIALDEGDEYRPEPVQVFGVRDPIPGASQHGPSRDFIEEQEALREVRESHPASRRRAEAREEESAGTRRSQSKAD